MRSPVQAPERKRAQISPNEHSLEMPVDAATWGDFASK